MQYHGLVRSYPFGGLSGSVYPRYLNSRLNKGNHARKGFLIQALHERLDNLERIRLPAMDSRIQHAIEAPLSQVLTYRSHNILYYLARQENFMTSITEANLANVLDRTSLCL